MQGFFFVAIMQNSVLIYQIILNKYRTSIVDTDTTTDTCTFVYEGAIFSSGQRKITADCAPLFSLLRLVIAPVVGSHVAAQQHSGAGEEEQEEEEEHVKTFSL